MVENVESFRNLGSVVDKKEVVERTIRARVATVFAEWCGISGLISNKQFVLKNKSACIRWVSLLGAE